MKKNVLALSIATLIGGLGFAGSASAALEVAESGAGHILLVPYYSAQEGNLSVFHLTNTDTVNGKAVKVRFRGASNSDDVLDFQVFLSPGDVWTGIVSKNPETGLANLVTADKTCTVPAIPSIAEGGQDFITNRLTRSVWTDADKAKQTLEGYVEILAMADIPSNDGKGLKGPNGKNGLFNTIKHQDGKAACDTAVLNATTELRRIAPGTPGATPAATGWNGVAAPGLGTDSYFLTVNEVRNAAADLVPTKGGLTGQWYIMNLEQNTTFSGVMTAITATTDVNNVFSPQLEEDATVVAGGLATADPLMNNVGGPSIVPQMYDVPDLSTAYEISTGDPSLATAAATQAKDLTDTILRTAVINQYATDVELDAKTDWVFSMPTRRYTIAADYSVTDVKLPAYRVVNNATDTPLTVAGNLFSTKGNSSANDKGQICAESGATTFWDREETTVTDPKKGPVFSPSTKPAEAKYTMCGEVGLLAFQDGVSALGADLTVQRVKAPYVNGWGVVPFGTDGVPVLGASFMKLTNLKVGNGIVANYGVTWNHTYK